MTPQSASTWEEIKTWRKAQRAQLVARRQAVPADERKSWNDRITEHLISGFDVPTDGVLGFCWPYKGEFDARYAVRRWREHGVVAALPEVVENRAPLRFRKWWPGAPMRAGVYDIPVPDGTEVVIPDVAIVPMNGFDACGYRLGYGGGFFDRTLAASERRMIAIGVSYEILRVETIYPQAHDIPMDFVVTENSVYAAGGDPLVRTDQDESRRRFARLSIARRLPRAVYASTGNSSPACYAAEFPGYWGEDQDGKPPQQQ
ncbi:MAG TPA: 5-formyltetrahydrofolate cyclo-ligase [Burkholderiales bacterium]